MRNTKYIYVLLIFLFLLVGCNPTNSSPVISTEEKELELYVGERYTPIIKVENATNYELIFTTDSNLISIENNEITCLEIGTCEVLVTLKNFNNVSPIKINITIKEKKPTKFTCDNELRIIIDQTYQLTPYIEPIDTKFDVEYSSNDSSVVEVDENGLLKGISEGQTYVNLNIKDYPHIKIRVLVIVNKPQPNEISTVDSLSLTYNQTYNLTWNVFPIEADQSVTFSSSDNSIVSIDVNGVLTAHKYGNCIIKVTSKINNNVFKEINVFVDGDKATEIIVEDNINLQLGAEYELNYKILPSTAYQKLEINVDDESALEISDNLIVPKKCGTYKLILTTIDKTNISKEIIVNIQGDEKPIFVLNDKFDEQSSLSWNENFNPRNNIRAFDNIDGEITENITIKGEVNNRKYGEYILEYYIEDSDGNSQTLIRKINVSWGYNLTVIGHAGSYYGVPNSEEAILYAAKVLQYPAIEIDLKQTKDGVFVLSHDPNWGDAILEETNYEDLKDIEYTVTKNQGLAGASLSEKERTFTAKICTFERYLEICKEYNITAVIELKTSSGISNWTEANAPHTSKMPEIMELIKKYEMLEQVIFLSSQELCLNWVKTNGYEYIPCQYLTLSSCENEKTYNIVKKYNLDISFNVRDGIKISDEWLEKYRALGCKLAVFTFEEYASYADIQLWIDRGVDFVTTDWHLLENLILDKQ